jgi:hypothetical protein
MNDTVTYEWSEELARASLRAVHGDSVARLPVVALGGALISIAGFSGYFLYQKTLALMGGVVGLLLLGVSLKVQMQIRRLAKDAARLRDDAKVSVVITDESITVVSGKSTSTVDYTKLTQLKEYDGFLLLYAGKLLVASLPRRAFREEHIEFFKSKVARSNHPTTPSSVKH